jgi:hypothetical protein
MSRLAVIAAAIALTVSPCAAQQDKPSPDPYRAAYVKQQLAAYQALRADTLDDIRLIYFAIKCRAVIDESAVWPLINGLQIVLRDEAASIPAIDPGLGSLWTAAIAKGQAQAAGDGCKYWSEHPDRVFALRRAADAYR